jgi:hypothetical protein
MKFETPLCELAYKHRADKCPQINHNYTPFYYELLKDKKQSIKKVLELGVGNFKCMNKYVDNYKVGASLFMWRDFFPNAQIYGADILPEVMFEDDRIQTFLCDETKEEDLKKLIDQTGPDIDLFIDDGSHNGWHQIFTCKTLMPLLKKDVMYIIEDVRSIRSVSRNLSEYNCKDVVFGRYSKIIMISREMV